MPQKQTMGVCKQCLKPTRTGLSLCRRCGGKVKVSVVCPACGVPRELLQNTLWHSGGGYDKVCNKCQIEGTPVYQEKKGLVIIPREFQVDEPEPVKIREAPSLSDPYQFARKRGGFLF
jgi:hypothetical protein